MAVIIISLMHNEVHMAGEHVGESCADYEDVTNDTLVDFGNENDSLTSDSDSSSGDNTSDLMKAIIM